MQALERWERTLDAILASRRRRLSGSEYVALIDEVDRAGDAREMRKMALSLVEKLARHDGAMGQARFGDPAMTRAYEAAGKRPHKEPSGVEARASTASPERHQGLLDARRDHRPRPT